MYFCCLKNNRLEARGNWNTLNLWQAHKKLGRPETSLNIFSHLVALQLPFSLIFIVDFPLPQLYSTIDYIISPFHSYSSVLYCMLVLFGVGI